MPIIDDFQGYSPNMQSPITHAGTITPSDTQDLGHLTRAVYIGSGGDLRVTLAGGDTLTFVNMVQGWHPIRAQRVWATDTSATHLAGCW